MHKKIFAAAVLTIVGISFSATTAFSQLGIGVSYEIRNEEPKSGFGVHAQFPILNLPLFSLSARAHYSYYSEENRFSADGLSYSEDRTSIEFGGTLMAGAGLGLLSPYIGVGLGWQNFSIESRILDQVDIDLPEEFDEDENAAKYYGVIGAAVTPVPLLRPFIEYRYAGITRDNLGPGSHGTWVFGVQLRF